MLPYPLTEPFRGVTQVQAGKGTFLEKRIFPVPDGKGGCPMTLLETLALLTLIVTVVCETINIMLKVLQYIESKHNKKD